MEQIFFLLDVGFLVAALVFTVMFLITIIHGRTLHNDDYRTSAVSYKNLKIAHFRHANGMLWSLALAIFFIETKVRLGGFADRSNGLIWTHLCFAVPMLLSLLILRFKITGTKNLSLHTKIAYASIYLFIGTAITGSMLFFNF